MFSTACAVKHLAEDKPRHCRPAQPLRALSLNSYQNLNAINCGRLAQRITPQRSMSALDELSGGLDALTANGDDGVAEASTAPPMQRSSSKCKGKGKAGAAAEDSSMQEADEPFGLAPQEDNHVVPEAAVSNSAGVNGMAASGTGPSAAAGPTPSREAAGLAALGLDPADAQPAISTATVGAASPLKVTTPKVARDDSWPDIVLESPAAVQRNDAVPAAASPTAAATAPVWNATPVPAAVDVPASPKAASPAAEATPPLPPPHPATPGKVAAAAAAAPAAVAPSAQASMGVAAAKSPSAAGEVVRASDRVDEVRESPVKVAALAQQLASPAAQPPKVPGISPRNNLSREPSAAKATALSTHDAVNTVNVAAKLQTGEFARKPGVDFVPYEELITLRLEDGIDATRKEEYLSDADFEKVFGMNRAAYQTMPQWKRLATKKDVNLF